MNPFNINHIKAEKANTIKQRYKNLRKITNFFRIFEIFLIFAVISRVSFELPFLEILKSSNEYIHHLSIFLVSPRFVFILGNAIIITLFMNSKQFNTIENTIKTPKNPPKSVKKRKNIEENVIISMIFSTPEEQIGKIYHHPPTRFIPRIENYEQGLGREGRQQLIPIKESTEIGKIYDRSKSEKMKRSEKIGCDLRRSKTEIKSLKSYCEFPEDHMSGEEFRKTVEDFIAKQQKFLREEEFCVFEEC
ncbi:unnamed protein product [Amaranthus hypochondriacus]